MQRAYDATASAYHEQLPDLRAEQPVDRAMIAAFAEHVRTLDPPAVLDVGCGTGRLVSTMQSGGLDVTGLDLSPGMIGIARSMHPEVLFHVADLAQMPVASGTFAGVLAWYSLIHVPPEDLAGALTEIARALKPGGFFLTGFQIGSGSRLLHHACSDIGDHDAYLRTPEEMAKALADAGLEPLARCTRAAVQGPYDGGYDQGFVLARKTPPPRPDKHE